MKLSRILAISRKNLTGLVRQKRTLALIFIAPVIAMFLFGYAFNGHAQNVSLIVVNEDSGIVSPSNNTTFYVSDLVISHLNNQPPNDVDYNIKNMTDLSLALSDLKDGKATAVLYFPSNFSKNTMENLYAGSHVANTSVQLYTDNSGLVGGSSTPVAVQSAIVTADAILGQTSAISFNVTPYYGSDVTFMDYFIPGIIAFVSFFLPTLLTLLLFVEEKTTGTFERILSTPMTEGELVSGYALTFGSLSVLQALVLFFSGVLAFHLSLNESFLLAILVIVVEAVGSQAFGILISGFAKRSDQAVQMIPFIVLPGLLLTGALTPVSVLPTWLQPFSYVLPPTYTTALLRDVLIRGWGFGRIWPYLSILFVFTVIFMIGAVAAFKRR